VNVDAESRAFRAGAADAYTGFNELYATSATRSASATEVACWADVRRNLHVYHAGTGSPLVLEAMTHIGKLFEVERLIHGQLPQGRVQGALGTGAARHDRSCHLH
jgi:hypothetical protein